MAIFGKRQPSPDSLSDWVSTRAEIREFKYGHVVTTSTGVDATFDRHSASKKLILLVEPATGPNYEATLKIERGGPTTPDLPGTRLQILVDPNDPQNVALPADPTFTFPGGQTWQPEHGLQGEIAEAAKRGDAQAIARLAAEARAASPQISLAGC